MAAGRSAGRGVRERSTGLRQREGEVGEQRTADLDRSASVDVLGGDDLAGAAARDAVPIGELRKQVVDASGVEVFGPVQDPPVGLVGGAAEEDVDVAVLTGLEDAHGVVCEDTVRLLPVIDDGDDLVVHPVRGTGI